MQTKPSDNSGILTAEQLIGDAAMPAAEPAPAGACPMRRTVCSAWDELNGECLATWCFYGAADVDGF